MGIPKCILLAKNKTKKQYILVNDFKLNFELVKSKYRFCIEFNLQKNIIILNLYDGGFSNCRLFFLN